MGQADRLPLDSRSMRRACTWLNAAVLWVFVSTACASSAPRPNAPAVLPVTNVPAARAAQVVRRVFPGLRVVEDAKANALVVVAAPETVRAVRDVLAGIDVKDPAAAVTEAIPLQRTAAGALVARLRAVYHGARVAAGPHGTLIVTAPPTDLAQIRALVSAVDAPPAPPPAATAAPLRTEAVRVTQAAASDVARQVAGALHGVRARVAGGSVVLAGAPDDVARAKELVAVFDQPLAGVRYTQVYRVRFLDAASVGDLLKRSFPGASVEVDAPLNALTVGAAAAQHRRIADALAQLDAGAAAPQNGPPLAQPGGSAALGPSGQLEVYTLRAALPGPNGAPSTNAADIAQTVGSALGQLAPDLHITVAANAPQLILTGSAYSLKLARDLIAQLDVSQKLVVLDTEILEVDASVAKNLGLSLSQPVLSTQYTETSPPVDPVTGLTRPLQRLQSFGRTPLTFGVTLNLLIQRGQARVLADPRITTVSGRTATIRAGDTIAILTTAGGGTGTVATTQLQTFQTGVTLDITPIVNAGNYISVSLHPTVNSLTGIVNGVPQIATRDTQTTVALQEDQTLIIGGLIQESVNRNETRVPLLGDLPLVGRAFRNSSVNSTRNELVITVTPHVVAPGEPVAFPNVPLPAIPTPQALPTLAPGTALPPPRKPAASATPAP
jgi:type II secretory pathway component GspD/PulD (secretin)